MAAGSRIVEPFDQGVAADERLGRGQPALLARDPRFRRRYLDAALAEIPRLLGAIDRNPYHEAYGCFDRQFWHYRTSDFPSEMYQEGVLPLALVFTHELPGNAWHGNRRVRELCLASLRFSARAAHADGSCDDYYPFERALGAVVFSLVAATGACLLLDVDDDEIRRAMVRRGQWLVDHDETGRLANHQALAALALWQLGRWTGRGEFRDAAKVRIARLLSWQHDEGWFDEYGGADPGYQSVTIDCLAKYRRQSGDGTLDEPIARAVDFARLFLHPDGSYAGEYGSRGTHHFYPHGAELLARESAAAADLADGFLQALAAGRQGHFADDRLFAHRLGNLIEAYLDWSPSRPPAELRDPAARWLPGAQVYVQHERCSQTIVSAARGGVLKHFTRIACDGAARALDTEDGEIRCTTDAGLIVEFADGRQAVSQLHTLDHPADVAVGHRIHSARPLHWIKHETATPLKLVAFRVLLLAAGRWCRSLVRWLLQRRLITARRACPADWERTIEFFARPGEPTGVRVTDVIRLRDPRLRVRRMSIGVDHQSTYVAACGVYQPSVLEPWTPLDAHVEALNAQRQVKIVREL